MTKYILHGGYERRENDLNDSFYREIANSLDDGATVLQVYFASEDEDLESTFKTQSQRVQSFSGKNLSFVLANEQDFVQQLRSADAVHFRGGNTNKLLKILKAHESLKQILSEKKLVTGSSAGAYALATYGTAHSELHVREGLGLLPIRLVCHYESPELPPSKESYDQLLTMAPELELVHLHDCEWRVFEQ